MNSIALSGLLSAWYPVPMQWSVVAVKGWSPSVVLNISSELWVLVVTSVQIISVPPRLLITTTSKEAKKVRIYEHQWVFYQVNTPYPMVYHVIRTGVLQVDRYLRATRKKKLPRMTCRFCDVEMSRPHFAWWSNDQIIVLENRVGDFNNVTDFIICDNFSSSFQRGLQNSGERLQRDAVSGLLLIFHFHGALSLDREVLTSYIAQAFREPPWIYNIKSYPSSDVDHLLSDRKWMDGWATVPAWSL